MTAPTSLAGSSPRVFLRHFTQVSIFQLVNSASAFLVNVWVARLVGPEAFGDFYFFVSTAVVSTILFDFGLTRTLLRYSAFHQARGEMEVKLGYYAAVLRLKTWLGLLVLGMAAGLGWFLLPGLRWPLLLGLATGFWVSYSQYFSAVAQTEKNYAAYNMVLSFNTLRLAGVALLAAWGLIAPGRIYLVFIAAPLVLAAWPAWRLGRDLAAAPRVPEEAFTSRIIRFGKWMIVLAVLETLFQRLDVILLRLWTNAQTAGLYSGALAFYGVVYLLPAYVAILIYPRLVEACGRNDKAAFRDEYRFSTDLVSLIGIPLALGLWAVSPDILRLFLGTAFWAAAPVFKYLALYSLLWSCQINSGAVFFAKDEPRLAVGVVAGALLVSAGLNALLIPRWGFVGAGLAVSAAMAASLAGYWGLIKIKFDLTPHFGHLGVYLFSAGIMAGCVRMLPWTGWIGLGVKTAWGVIVYAGLLWMAQRWLPGGSLPDQIPAGGFWARRRSG
ncbi:polysaccharide biosynthesis C-terminal domain-containing protein [candidate division FCPU426 bacterium]|nr:polysaccharide biosynthesis C-terminal domain-containing protein [candidate division FCPU426 bacterium]